MKLTSLLLSSAAVLVAGSAFAADLPAKKAAPAAAVTACPAFGGGFFTIPGSDTCIKFSGFVRDQMTFQSAADRAAASSGTENEFAMYSNAASFRLNIDTRSNTEIGVVRGYARIDGNELDQAYIQAGGFTLGLAGTWMGNGGGLVAPTFGSHGDSTQVSYSAAIGGGKVTIAVLDADANSNDSSASGVAQIPDLMATISVPMGGATLGLGAVMHEARDANGATSGYAIGATLGFAPAAGVSMGIEGGYASAALGYLGTSGAASGLDPANITDVPDSVAGVESTGYVVSGYASFEAGKGTINLYGGYTVLSDATEDVTASTIELDYAYTVASGLTITPGVAYIMADESAGGESANTTVAVIRIQRDF